MRKEIARKYLWLLLLIATFSGAAFSQNGTATQRVNESAAAQANTVETLKLTSKLMAREMPYRVILPVNYSRAAKTINYPVIYLLHGLGGHYNNWTDKPKLTQYESG